MAAQQRKRILLADDTLFFRRAFREALELSACEVVETEDGAAAWRAIEENPKFDLVLLDEVMPGMRGTDVLARMVEKKIILPTVLLSGIRGHRIDPADYPKDMVKASLSKARPLDELVYGVNNLLFTGDQNVREWPRVPTKAIAQYRKTNGYGPGSWHVGRIWDLSRSGLQLRTPRDMTLGETLELRFFLPGAKQAVECHAKVAWSRTLETDDANNNATGIEFTDMPPQVKKELQSFIDRRVADLLS